MQYRYVKKDGEPPYVEVAVTDYGLINHSLLNKGMAFNYEERETFNLLGLLPPDITDLKNQRERSYLAFKNKANDLERYIYLQDLQNSNETLFYSLLHHHLEEVLPIVYTPTVGLGCQRFSHIYRRPRGLFIAYPDAKRIDAMLANKRFDNAKIIVVTDGERILGLGDQGSGGMAISIGKLSLYTACAGIHPTQTLPIVLDVGTNNQNLIHDPLYIGWRNERIRGKEYDDFIDSFVTAIKKRFPHILLHWEDFAQQNANPILQRYRNQLCTFNDDIQGTAAVVVGTLLSAVKVTQTALTDQRIVIVGAGSAGCGIADLIKRAMMGQGISEAKAKENLYLIDSNGLLIDDNQNLKLYQQPFAQPKDKITSWKLNNANQVLLADVIDNLHPTVLIGVSGQANIFSETLIKTMYKYVKQPIIFPLSNPPSRCEAKPQDLLTWTQDNAIISTGSPYPDVVKHGKSFRIDQTNNCYIFPGLGLGLVAVKANIITDDMFMVAAKTLAERSIVTMNASTNLLPSLADIRDVSLHVAIAVAKEAIREGYATYTRDTPLEEYIQHYMWEPHYLPYRKLEE